MRTGNETKELRNRSDGGIGKGALMKRDKDEFSQNVFQLWDQLAEFELARSDEARTYLLGELCQLVDGCDAVRFIALRLGEKVRNSDPLSGWRPSAIRHLYSRPVLQERAKDAVARSETGDVDATTIANIAGAGQFRVNLLSELAPAHWYEESFYKKFYLDAGHSDAIWAGIPINADVEVYVGIYRALGKPPFDIADRDVIAFVLRALKWFLRAQALSEGFGAANNPLTVTERRVLSGLLQGLPDKEIASSLGQSLHTTREYVKRIHDKFGVPSRAALMALWLGKAPPS